MPSRCDGVGREARPAEERDLFRQRHFGDQLIRPFIGCAFGVLRLDHRGIGGRAALGLDSPRPREQDEQRQTAKEGLFHNLI